MADQLIQQIFADARRLLQAGRLREAEHCVEQIIAIQPRHAESLHLLAVVRARLGRRDEAIDLLRRAIAIENNPALHNELGAILKETGRAEEAIAEFRQAIALKANYADAHNNLGNALKAVGRLGEATAAYQDAIRFSPDHAEAHNNLGNAMMASGRMDEAIAAYRRAIALFPRMPKVHSNLGNALKEQGRLDEAIIEFRRATVVEPNEAAVASNLVFALNFHHKYDARFMSKIQENWSRRHAEPFRQYVQPHANDRSAERKLVIGYVSPDFRDHVVGRNLVPLFQHHDHRQFEIVCYSQVLRPDAMTKAFQQRADRWRNIVGLHDQAVADQIREDKVDILVDLALHMAQNRLQVFARKPAPVQIAFAGYPGSTGLGAMDYRLSDPHLDPPGSDTSIYSEQTVRLPNSFWCYDPLEARQIAINALPAQEAGHITFGCLNNFCKVNDRVLALWAQVMRQVPDSKLLMLAAMGSHRDSTLKRMADEGIDPQRIAFVPRQSWREYIQTYHRIDLALDTFPYNGHTTSLDGFWMGVPVITLVGQSVVSRAGWSQLSNLGLTELAAHSDEQFVEIAVRLAGDLPRLAELRASLRDRMERSPLTDGRGFAAAIEAAYREAWQTWIRS